MLEVTTNPRARQAIQSGRFARSEQVFRMLGMVQLWLGRLVTKKPAR